MKGTYSINLRVFSSDISLSWTLICLVLKRGTKREILALHEVFRTNRRTWIPFSVSVFFTQGEAKKTPEVRLLLSEYISNDILQYLIE